MNVYTKLAFAKHALTGEVLYFCKLKDRNGNLSYERPFNNTIGAGCFLYDGRRIIKSQLWSRISKKVDPSL